MFDRPDRILARLKTTVLLCDGFAVLDREWPDVDSKLGGKRQRLARDRERRSRPLVARALHQRPLGQSD